MSIGIDSKVRITGPSAYMGACAERIGDTFIVDQMWKRKDELKIGDRVICDHGYSVVFPEHKLNGKTGTVKNPNYVTSDGVKCVHVEWDDGCLRTLILASSLCKLDKPKIELSDEAKAKIGKAIWKKMERDEERLEGIEKRLDEQNAANDKLRKRCHNLEFEWNELLERVRFLEAWRKEEMSKVRPCEQVIAEDPVIPKILDEPIKVGDWVQVTGQPYALNHNTTGQISKVKSIDRSISGRLGIILDDGIPFYYPPSSLRKLPDAEIASKLNEGA